MAQYIVRRLLMMLLVLWGVSVATFAMIHIAPGDPVDLLMPDYGTAQDVARIRARLGLDQPLPVQYLRYVESAVRLDFGRSIRTNAPVSEEIMARWPITVELTVAALLITTGVGVPVGVLSATKQNSFLDYGSMVLALVWVSMPTFFLAVVLQIVFGTWLHLFPVAGYGGPFYTEAGLRSLVMPAFTLGAGGAAIVARLTRSSVLEVLRHEYIRTARSKGLSERVVLYKHALRNALIPVVTIVGLQFGGLLGGAFITETIFARPGVGRLAVLAIFNRDIPVIQAIALMMATIFVLTNLAVDLVYAALDPRIRYH
jgi:peptide/nickel transport system permease protein